MICRLIDQVPVLIICEQFQRDSGRVYIDAQTGPQCIYGGVLFKHDGQLIAEFGLSYRVLRQ